MRIMMREVTLIGFARGSQRRSWSCHPAVEHAH